MGLDMFLIKKIYVGEEFQHRKTKTEVQITIEDKTIKIEEPIKEISISVGYWRKANAIHDWFVKNVQDGKDDCKEYLIEDGKLEELMNLCTEVALKQTIAKGKEDVASKKLPTCSGFFFGSTDYDEYYFEDLKNTIDILERVLKQAEKDRENGLDVEFYYRSSW